MPLVLIAFSALAEKPGAWLAPANARERANPVPASDEGLKRGRLLFQRHCAMCHGEKGRGDGPAARLHAQRSGLAPRNLNDPQVQSALSDGEIYWKLSTGLKLDGKIVMPGFAEEITKEEDRWRLVHYGRQFGKAGG